MTMTTTTAVGRQADRMSDLTQGLLAALDRFGYDAFDAYVPFGDVCITAYQAGPAVLVVNDEDCEIVGWADDMPIGGPVAYVVVYDDDEAATDAMQAISDRFAAVTA